MDIINFLRPILLKMNLLTVLLTYLAVTYLDIALGISKAIKLGTQTIEQIFKSRTFLYSLPLKFTLITTVGILYWIGSLLSHELSVMLVIPLFVYEISSIIENFKALGISYNKFDNEKDNKN